MKKDEVRKYNRILATIDTKNPLSIGNGDLALTLDITGSQTLTDMYKDIPLSTISNRIWFKKNNLGNVLYEDIKGKKYLTSSKGQEEIYEDNRRYPHKFNLFKIMLTSDSKEIDCNKIQEPKQELDLYTGTLSSKFKYNGVEVKSTSIVYQDADEMFYSLYSENLEASIIFTYPSYNKEGYINDLKPSVSRLGNVINIVYNDENKTSFEVYSNSKFEIVDNKLVFEKTPSLEIRVLLTNKGHEEDLSSFWEKDSDILIDDEKINERMILSKYLLKINCTGIYPPAESGLTYNNWYSKFHLEMHMIHTLWLIKSNHIDLFLKTMPFYESIKDEAASRAKLNGYKGLRFPKMTSPDGLDSPSNIGPLLIWQAPHILYCMQEIYKVTKDTSEIAKYADIIKGVTDFMISFLSFKEDRIEMIDPLLECSESIPLDKCNNPMFEIEYFRETFERQTALDLALFNEVRYNYSDICQKLVLPKVSNGIYLRTHGIVDSFDIYPDHPTEVFAYSYFKSKVIDDEIMNNTIDFCTSKLDFSTFWGWDFPFMGLCLLKLGRVEDAIKITFDDCANNQYLYNGHNTTPQEALKIYLPANGAFLLFYQELSKIKNIK